MHESLKRPLFRKRAMEVYQARQGGKVPGYVYGALIQGARAAGPFIARQFARPNVQKGLLGLEGAGIVAGVEETKRGIKGEESLYTDSPATISGGLATLLPGVGLAGKALPRAFPGSVRALGAGESMTAKFPFNAPFTTALIGGTLSLPEARVREFVKEEKNTRVPEGEEQKVVEIFQQIKALPTNASIGDVTKLILNSNISEAAKDKVLLETLELSPQQVKVLKENRQDQPQTEKSSKSTLPQSPIEKTVEQNLQAQINNIDPNSMSPQAQEELAVKKVRQQEGANREVNKALEQNKDNDNFKNQFSFLKNQIQQVTGGGSGDMSNLIIMKLAAGLATGKTTQRGVAGFLDVLGQASGPAIDTAILLANQEKEFDQSLALAILKNKSEQSTMKAAPGLVYYQEENIDPKTGERDKDFPTIGRTLRIDKDTGAPLVEVIDPVKGVTFVPYTAPTGKPYTPNLKLKTRAEQQMRERETVIEMGDLVAQMDVSQIGPRATAMKLMRQIDGTINSFTKGKYANSSEYVNLTYDQILSNISDSTQYEGMSDAMKTARSKANEKLINEFKKEDSEIREKKQKALSDGDEERVAQANLSFVENRMKYSLANSNKFEDRVNQYDVVSAEKDTKIYKYVSDPRQIQINYAKIAADANVAFGRDAARYVANSGRIEDLEGLYPNVKFIQEYQRKKSEKKTQSKPNTNVQDNLINQFYGVK